MVVLVPTAGNGPGPPHRASFGSKSTRSASLCLYFCPAMLSARERVSLGEQFYEEKS